ncbi:hypothetical protein A2964_00855 [Candidatus Daviesbacteria bacterium RIFCSPLOWO2_01_FULL_40_27]|nr:MAG: hypothetical protein A2964_00855 [Candidatus Daviesbacteria bacterium RIFCSPLOWO2_01_FULL_40_27]
MIFFEKYPSAIYIQKNSLSFYINGEEKHLEFPEDTVSEEDIINPAKYSKLIADFITAENIKSQRVLLVLSEEIIFKKLIPATDLKLLDEKLADFTEMIPLESGKLIKKTVKLNANIYLFAVNKQLFEIVLETLEGLGFKVLAVVPLSLYSADNSLNEDIVRKIYKDRGFLKSANFLNDSSVLSNGGKSKQALAIILFLLAIVIILSFFLINIYLKQSRTAFKKDLKTTEATLEASPTSISTESAAPETSTESATLAKDRLRVSILNGTGIAGQAVKIKNLLIPLGLSKIEVDNAGGASTTDTIVIFSPVVAPDLQNEIAALLQEEFDNVSIQNDLDSLDVDILITTGKPKATP